MKISSTRLEFQDIHIVKKEKKRGHRTRLEDMISAIPYSQNGGISAFLRVTETIKFCNCLQTFLTRTLIYKCVSCYYI